MRERRLPTRRTEQQIAHACQQQNGEWSGAHRNRGKRLELPQQRAEHSNERHHSGQQEMPLGEQPVPFADPGRTAQRNEEREKESSADYRRNRQPGQREAEQWSGNPIDVQLEAPAETSGLFCGSGTRCHVGRAAHATGSGATEPKRRSRREYATKASTNSSGEKSGHNVSKIGR